VWRAGEVARAGLRYQGIGVPSHDGPPIVPTRPAQR